MLHRPAPLAALLVAILTSAGCGGAAPSGAAKSYAPGATGVDQALADLDAAEAEIAGRFGPLASAAPQQPGDGVQQGYPQAQPGASSPYAQPPAAPPPPPAGATAAQPGPEPMAAAPSEPPSDDEAGAEERAEREAEERCALACRALGSMRRAADHVCRAAGAGDPRCLRARDRVTAADQRVRESCDECD